MARRTSKAAYRPRTSTKPLGLVVVLAPGLKTWSSALTTLSAELYAVKDAHVPLFAASASDNRASPDNKDATTATPTHSRRDRRLPTGYAVSPIPHPPQHTVPSP